MKETTSFMRFLEGVVWSLPGLVRGLNPSDRGLKAVVNDSKGFEQVLTRVVSKTACIWNEISRVASLLTRHIRNLTPFAPRSSGSDEDVAGVRRKLKGIRWFLSGRRFPSRGVRKRLSPSSLSLTAFRKRLSSSSLSLIAFRKRLSSSSLSLIAFRKRLSSSSLSPIDLRRRSRGVRKSLASSSLFLAGPIDLGQAAAKAPRWCSLSPAQRR
ncbi:MAG TPA: hypothetical protein VMB50_05795 [Myxococcales bacterium]|nr:hypothetical protein [Myxococcales bacterium]